MKDGKSRKFYLDRAVMQNIVTAFAGTLAMDDKHEAAYEPPKGKPN